MKITFILAYYPWRVDGGCKVVYTYANELARRGHEVRLVYPSYFRHSVRRFSQVFRVLDRLYSPPIRWHEIDSRVKSIHVPEPTSEHVPPGDVVIATFWAAVPYINAYPNDRGRRVYLVQAYEDWFGPVASVDDALKSDVLKVVISKGLYEKVVSLGVDKSKIAYIPNAVNPADYPLSSPLEERGPCVVLAYNRLWVKGGREGLKVLELVKKGYPGAEAIVFSTYRRPMGVPKWVEWHHNPTHDELVGIYNRGAVYLCPSYSEGWHLPAAEAMSCGCALVSTNQFGVGDYAVQMETALLSPVGDCQGLARNVTALLEDEGLRRRIASAGHKKIGGFGDWGRNISRLERFISSDTTNIPGG